MHQGIKGFAHSFWVFDGQKLTARPVTDQWLGPWRLCSASWDTLMPPPTSLIYVCIIFNYSLSTDWKSMESWEAVAWGSDCDPSSNKIRCAGSPGPGQSSRFPVTACNARMVRCLLLHLLLCPTQDHLDPFRPFQPFRMNKNEDHWDQLKYSVQCQGPM